MTGVGWKHFAETGGELHLTWENNMNTTNNTILITGGGSGIGQGLAEAFHKLGNQVVISGRRKDALDQVTAANPGMKSLTLDIENPESINSFAAKLIAEFPKLNAVIHNAGIMRAEKVTDPTFKAADAEVTIATNLLGPIRLNAAILPHLLKQPKATIMTVSSGLAFVPLTATLTYCATKAAIHSYSVSLRHQLQATSVQVIELAPPYVQTQLMGEGQASDPNAMPLADFIAEVLDILTKQPDATEVIVKRVEPLRFAVETGAFRQVFNALNALPLPH